MNKKQKYLLKKSKDNDKEINDILSNYIKKSLIGHFDKLAKELECYNKIWNNIYNSIQKDIFEKELYQDIETESIALELINDFYNYQTS